MIFLSLFSNLNADIEYDEEWPIYFFERNRVGRDLKFEQKVDFLRYTIQLDYINLARDIAKCPLPPLG